MTRPLPRWYRHREICDHEWVESWSFADGLLVTWCQRCGRTLRRKQT